MIASAAALREREALAQSTPVHTYEVNDGRNDTYDSALGEFAIDLGGHIPWERYRDTTLGTGHYYARTYAPPAGSGAPSTFSAWMYDALIDLETLRLKLPIYCPAAPLVDVVPTILNGRVIPDPAAANLVPSQFPAVAPSWWGDQVVYWQYKLQPTLGDPLSGGSMMICARDNNPNDNKLDVAATPSILLYNYNTHGSEFGTNKNRWQPTPLWPREFQPDDGSNPLGPFFAEAGWPNSKGPKEQALEAGDLVVFVQENYSQNFWIGLQRTQEAEWFVRNVFAQAPPKPAPGGGTVGNYDSIASVGRAFLHGISWGQLVSTIYSRLQPKTYSGSVEWETSDIGYNLSDGQELQFFFSLGLDRDGPPRTTATNFVTFYQLVDLLGIRFDNPRHSQQPWDVAALSVNYRPSVVGVTDVPIFGEVGDNELYFSPFWPRSDPKLGSGPHAAPRCFRNLSHSKWFGYTPGINEYAFYDGTEWSDLKSRSTGPSAANSPLVPTTTPPNPYPDPYSHTLRHVHVTASTNPNLLTEADAHQLTPTTATYKAQSSVGASINVKSLGQGVCPAVNDTMHVVDLDGDGKLEVVFGNFDGFVHVLEFDPTRNPFDPYRLYDEWKSPYLSWGIGGHDMYFAAGKAQMFFATSKGEIWRINALGHGNYQVANGGQPIAVPDPLTDKYIYPGSTPILLVNDLDFLNSGFEILVMNRFFDWAMFKLDGTKISNGRMERYLYIVGPTDAFPVDIDGSSPKEVLVTAADGNVWQLNSPSSSGGWTSTNERAKSLIQPGSLTITQPGNVIKHGNLELHRVVPCHFNGSANPPTHLLLFGGNSDLDDADATIPTSIVQIWDLRTPSPTLTGSSSIQPGASPAESSSFAWIKKPQAGNNTYADFACAGPSDVQTFRVSLAAPTVPGTAAAVTALAQKNVLPKPTKNDPRPESINSIDVAPLKDGSNVSSFRIILMTSDGRIFVMDTGLNFLRFSDQEFIGSSTPPPIGATFLPWQSNRSIGHVYACDLDPTTTSGGSGDVYFAQFNAPLFELFDPAANKVLKHWRLGKIFFTPTTSTWDGYVQDAQNDRLWDSLFGVFNRTLLYRDLDPAIPGREMRIFAESGTAYLDSPPVGTGMVREFQTASLLATSIFGTTPAGNPQQGGRVFERKPPTNGRLDYDYLGGFVIRNDPAFPCEDFNGGGEGWWYPRIGSNFLSGQIANPEQSVTRLGLGTSMKAAMLRMGEGQPAFPHLVVGSNNGFVYAIRPGAYHASPGMVSSTLSYQSLNMGQFIVGLDVGDLDGDADDEIVCGDWIDNGTAADWMAGNLKKNRAHLYILDPVPGSGNFTATVLDGDDLLGLGNGIGSGVTGVKIDDVNGVGDKEIWCSDAVGHIYLFRHAGSLGWICLYRSGDLGIYPGCYNNIFPIKGGPGDLLTVKLAVVSPGYVMLFDVDPSLVPP